MPAIHQLNIIKLLFLTVLFIILAGEKISAQKTYATSRGHVSFFAKAPISDVDAHNDHVKISLNTSTGELTVDMSMKAFEFKNKKMGRDARRNYIEIDKFPQASFNGKISEKVDYDKPGSYTVSATGKLNIHGVANEVTEKGTIRIEGKQIRIHAEFNVALKDHKIERPRILGQEMTADNVRVTVDATLSPRSK